VEGTKVTLSYFKKPKVKEIINRLENGNYIDLGQAINDIDYLLKDAALINKDLELEQERVGLILEARGFRRKTDEINLEGRGTITVNKRK
jgi:hypothetical protein